MAPDSSTDNNGKPAVFSYANDSEVLYIVALFLNNGKLQKPIHTSVSRPVFIYS